MTDSPGAASGDEPVPVPGDGGDGEAVGGRRPSALLVLATLIMVGVVAQAVIGLLSLGVISQVRDQSATANGLQRCLIQAQLSASSSTDTAGAAYRAAVQACLNK